MSDRKAEVVNFGKYHVPLELRFTANSTVRQFPKIHPSQLIMHPQAESLRSSLHELEGLIKNYTPLMSRSMERAFGKGIQLGTVFAEVRSPVLETS